MFKITERPIFTHDVTVLVPTDGGHREDTFRARFQAIPSDEAETYELSNTEELKAFLREVVIGFEDVVGDDNKPLPSDDDLKERMLRLSYVRLALLRTYMTAITKARLGN